LAGFSLLPRQENFFGLFEDSARNLVKSARVLQEMLESWDMVEVRVAEITGLEHCGDSITHQIME